MPWNTLPLFWSCRNEATDEHEQRSFVLHTQRPRFLLECTAEGPMLCQLIDAATEEEIAPLRSEAFGGFSGQKVRALLAEHSTPEINFTPKRATDLVTAMSFDELLVLIPEKLTPGTLQLALPDPEGKSRLPKGSPGDPFARCTFFNVEVEPGISREQLAQNIRDWCNESAEEDGI